ncbi:hypothetical protein [Sphingomonas glacialis]|uniref:hypothetical protein n=1 Tax=Sphingomonas glacialis TaxID=658225 RepID=UPI001129D716|nr:hypothetical protein [Sphingomonas glacialis]
MRESLKSGSAEGRANGRLWVAAAAAATDSRRSFAECASNARRPLVRDPITAASTIDALDAKLNPVRAAL